MSLVPMEYTDTVKIVPLRKASLTLSAYGEGNFGVISSHIPSGYTPIGIYAANYGGHGGAGFTPVLYNNYSVFILGSPNQTLTNIVLKMVCVATPCEESAVVDL